MNAEFLRNIPTIQEFFNINPGEELKEGTRLLLEAMEEVHIEKGKDVVTLGAESDDGMYIILSGSSDVLDGEDKLINSLSAGDFIGELGLINDDKRVATVRAATDLVCANISKNLFEEIAGKNRKIYGTFMNMLYTKTTKLVTEQERIKMENKNEAIQPVEEKNEAVQPLEDKVLEAATGGVKDNKVRCPKCGTVIDLYYYDYCPGCKPSNNQGHKITLY